MSEETHEPKETGLKAKRVVFEHGKYRVVIEEREQTDGGAFWWETKFVVYPFEIECDNEHEALLKLLEIVCEKLDEREAHWQKKLRALVVEKNTK